jgi:hypothetical protein
MMRVFCFLVWSENTMQWLKKADFLNLWLTMRRTAQPQGWSACTAVFPALVVARFVVIDMYRPC